MVETANVVVIGGGCIGTSIAMHLALRGVKKVVLVEKKYLASGSTGKSVGNVRPFSPVLEIMELTRRSLHVFQNFKEEVGGDPGLVSTTRVRIASEKDKEILRADAEWEGGIGANIRFLSPQELSELIPQLNIEGIGGAIHYLDACYLNPIATTGAFAMRARDLGVDLREETEIVDIKVSGGKVKSVITDKGEISTPAIVNATGIWAQNIGHMVGIDIPMTLRREQIFSFLRPWDFRGTFPIIHDLINEHLYRSDGDEMMLAMDMKCFLREEAVVKDPDNYNEEVETENARTLIMEMPVLLPTLKRASYRGGFSGLFDVTPDDNPILSKVPGIEGIYLCCGWLGLGVGQCPAIGEVVAELITEDRTTLIDWTVFRLSRFKEGKPLKVSPRSAHRPS